MNNTINFNDLRASSIEKMAKINDVEGFDPRVVTSCYVDDKGEAKMYLQAEPAMLWFRLKHPNGRLEQVVTRCNDSMATVEGRVYDGDGILLANAFATRYRSDDQFGKDYVQNAGTAAIRKALGNCGFGTPVNAEYIEGVTPRYETAQLSDAPVDGGVAIKIPVPPTPLATRGASAKAKKEKAAAENPVMVDDAPLAVKPKATEKAIPVPPVAADISPDASVEPAPIPVPVALSVESHKDAVTPADAAKTVSAPAVVAAAKPVEKANAVAPETLQDALAFVIPMGLYAGKTLKEMLDAGNGKAIAYFLRPQYNGKPVQAAARLVAGQYGL